MPDSRFPILGAAVPPMLGRASILQKMAGALTKAIPDHVQVIGPKFAGKTVILHELTARLRQAADSPYAAVLLWDLGHQTPPTDALFMQGLARELSAALKASHPIYAEHLKSNQENPYHEIAEVLNALKDEGTKILAIMDRFDKPLSNGHLTRNLWDQLLDLARKPSLRLVTASRQSLYQLLRSPESQTSDFWGIFDTKIHVGCFDETDVAAVLERMPERPLSAGANTELWNASNGSPILVLGILNAVCEMGVAGTVSPEAMRAACDIAFPAVRDKLDALWIDCPPSCQDLMRRLLDEGAVARAGLSAADIEALIERGFAHTASNKLQRPNRLLGRYLEEEPNEGNALIRLFGSADAYQKNLKSVLERRIGHIKGMDPTLRQFLELGATLLPDHPIVFSSNIRGIVDKAFDLIWKAELPEKRIPADWMAIWEYNKEGGLDKWKTSFPTGVHRLRLLNLMIGTDKSAAYAKHITKGTYVLMNAVHGFGDFGQHREGAPIDPGTAYAALHLCVELAAALTRELPHGP